MNECFGHLACCHAPSRAAFFMSTYWIITRGIDAVPHSSSAKDHVQAVINTHTDLPCQTNEYSDAIKIDRKYAEKIYPSLEVKT